MKFDVIKTVDEYFNEYIKVEGNNLMKNIPKESQEFVGLAVNKCFQDMLNDGFVLIRKHIFLGEDAGVQDSPIEEPLPPPEPEPEPEEKKVVKGGFLGKLKGRT